MKALFWVAGAVGTIVGLATILWSDTVQDWADGNPRILFGGVVLLASACIVLGDLVWKARGRTKTLRETLDVPVGREPSSRDRDLFARFLAEFPPDNGSIVYLQSAFAGKQWRWSRLDEVDQFASKWDTGVFFDDADVERARQDLLAACQTFVSDSAAESYSPGENDDIARLEESYQRYGGQEEWEAARKQLRDDAAAVVRAHDTLHRLGRERGL